jgi:hypothetical protein
MTSFVNGRGGRKIPELQGISNLTDRFSSMVNRSARQIARRTDPIRDVRPIARR